MKNEINAVLENMTTATPEPEDYTGEDGLLYCGKCRKPKEAYFAPDILDDFGMERGTEYGLEQVFNVIDSRYRSGKPLIVTTNLTLDDLRNPEDTAHSRIYDRLLSMCVPVRFTGDNFRQEAAQRKMESMKKLITD